MIRRDLLVWSSFALFGHAMAGVTKPWLQPIPRGMAELKPGLYPMVDGVIEPARWADQNWFYRGVTVWLDGRPLPPCYEADTEKGYVTLVTWRETPMGLTHDGRRAYGQVTIEFPDPETRRDYLRWVRTRKGSGHGGAN